VDCNAFEKALAGRDRTTNAISPLMRDHIARCAACRDLLILLTADEVEIGKPSPALIDAVTARVLADLQPIVPMRPASHFAVVFTTIFCALTAAGLLLFRPLGILLMNHLQAWLILFAIVVCAAATIVSLARQVVPARLHSFAPERVIAFIPVGLALLLLIFLPVDPAPDFWKRAGVCIAIGLGLATLSGSALFVVLRRGAVMSVRLAGGTAGLLAGLVAFTVLEIHCPILDPLHAGTSHTGVVVLAVVAGALAAPKAVG
jgi:hypothetical protein